MQKWTLPGLEESVIEFDTLSAEDQSRVRDIMNAAYPPPVYQAHRQMRRNALVQSSRIRELLASGSQSFPPFIAAASLPAAADALRGFSIVFTAGGEGERLRISLQQRGVAASTLRNFTKATYGLPGFPADYGTLHINLLMVAQLCRQTGIDIPVVITTGPSGSITADVIPAIIERCNNFGIKHLRIIGQNERLFLTNEEKVVLQKKGTALHPVTHPDETGGPIMKLKASGTAAAESSILNWMSGLGCSRTIIVQATALYHQSLLPMMAAGLGTHDCLGVGILRESFPASDPYGTFVSVRHRERTTLQIIEQDVRNDVTRALTDGSQRWYLPFNTGFYAFENRLLEQNDLPDFATPPKELRPDLPRAPKIGYAATDLIALAKDPIILTIEPSLFGVLKNADDLEKLAALGKRFGLDEVCKKVPVG